MVIVDFICWIVAVALTAAFLLALATKWGWIEWLQVHAPTEWMHELFNCKFCCSWWVCVFISLTLLAVTGQWQFVFVPVCSTMIARMLW